MKTFRSLTFAVLCCLLTTAAWAEVEADKTVLEGRALAEELCSMAPLKDSSMTGTLYIRQDRKTEVSVPIEMKLIKGEHGWKSIYQTRNTNAAQMISLTIIQSPGSLNSYELLSGTNEKPQEIAHNTTGVPFAGSDFWISDLGLEFFRWKDQRVTKHELRRGQACLVLESKNTVPQPGTYAKVISWIDKDTLGIVRAEAYDQQGKLMKLFLPTKVKKVDGRYQIKEVEMRNEQTGLKSRLEFDLETE